MFEGAPDQGRPLEVAIRRLEKLVTGDRLTEGLRALALNRIRLLHCELEELVESGPPLFPAVAAAAKGGHETAGKDIKGPDGEQGGAPDSNRSAAEKPKEPEAKRSRSRRRRRKSKDEKEKAKVAKTERKDRTPKKERKQHTGEAEPLPSVTPPAPVRSEDPRGTSPGGKGDKWEERHRKSSPDKRGEHTKRNRHSKPHGRRDQKTKEERSSYSPEPGKGRA